MSLIKSNIKNKKYKIKGNFIITKERQLTLLVSKI
jgi:hypothetical protein